MNINRRQKIILALFVLTALGEANHSFVDPRTLIGATIIFGFLFWAIRDKAT